jgi:hypothetical protein
MQRQQNIVLPPDVYDAIELVALVAGGIGINEADNDPAVRAINARFGRTGFYLNDRVPFELWRQELGIVRGPHPDPSPNATWPD